MGGAAGEGGAVGVRLAVGVTVGVTVGATVGATVGVTIGVGAAVQASSVSRGDPMTTAAARRLLIQRLYAPDLGRNLVRRPSILPDAKMAQGRN